MSLQGEQPARSFQPDIVVIGLLRRGSMELLRHISGLTRPERIVQYESIERALNDPDERILVADLVIVLQDWPDQYSRAHAEQLVGQTIFGRLLCCYGAWCESDGRTREVWPDAVRIPIRLAAAHIDNELRHSATGVEPVPPTSARDEIFTHRMQSPDGWPMLDSGRRLNAAVVGPDREFRRTLAMALSDLGFRSLSMPLIEVRTGETIREQETSEGPIHVVIHDLDPWGQRTSASLEACRQMFPSAAVLGVATMPDGGLNTEIADHSLVSVIPKLDMELGLRWHLQCWYLSQNVLGQQPASPTARQV